MRYSGYLLFEGSNAPKGDSLDANHKDHIEISAFAFAVENPATIASAGRSRGGTAVFQPLTITKRVDKTSPPLFRACAAGEPFDKVILKLAGPGGGADVAVYTFKLVYLTNIAWPSGKDDEVPLEQLQLVCGAVQLSIPTEDASGRPGKPVEASWSQVTNTATLDTP